MRSLIEESDVVAKMVRRTASMMQMPTNAAPSLGSMSWTNPMNRMCPSARIDAVFARGSRTCMRRMRTFEPGLKHPANMTAANRQNDSSPLPTNAASACETAPSRQHKRGELDRAERRGRPVEDRRGGF